MGKKIIINESKLRAIVRNILIEQVADLETALKEMGFVKTTPGNYKHNKDSKLTISIVGNNVIVKKSINSVVVCFIIIVFNILVNINWFIFFL